MPTYKSKHNFTAGEVSPLLFGRSDFERFKNGCRKLTNMLVLSQGPVTRRSGFEYIASLSELGIDPLNPKVRLVDFIFNEDQAYCLVFFEHTSGVVRCVFAVNKGLIVYPDPPPTECPAGTPIVPALVAGDVMYIDMPAGWDIDTFDYAQSGDYMYFAQGGLAPYTLVRNGLYCWTVELPTFVDQPANWSIINGWPETVTFIQQRLAFGGSTLDRQTIWMTRAGDFSSFAISSPLVDADAVTFTLDSGTQNKILWMQTVKKLHVGTVGDEWVVGGNGQTTITTSGVLSENPTNQGSQRTRPLRIGLATMFLERHGRVINEFLFDYNYDSNKAVDMTILAPHLTDDFSYTRWAYQKTPSSIVWCVRSDGALNGLTYQKQHNVIAWHPHDTQGAFKDVCSIPGVDREDDLWTVVMRVVEGVDMYYLEKMATQFKGTAAIEGNFLDSFLRYEGASTDTISGLDHLEGLEVYILADGAVHPPRTVVGGSITLLYESTNVLVGLYFESEVNPLIEEVMSRDNGGSTTKVQRILQYRLSLYKSLGFEMGTYDIDGNERSEEKPFRTPLDLTGQALPLFTGIYTSDGFEGSDEKAEYFIRQRQPLPLTIIGVVDYIEVK